MTAGPLSTPNAAESGPARPPNGQSGHLDEALALAAAGYTVHPLRLVRGDNGKIAKIPLSPRGFHDATTDAGLIRGWWRQHPDAVPGVAVPPDTVVVDLDWYKPEYRKDHGLHLPATVMQETGSGGVQLLYRTDGKRRARQTASSAAPAIDTRVGGRGFVVAWEAAVLVSNPPASWPLAPDWVYETRVRAEPIVGDIPEGRRHADLVSLAGSMRARGMLADEIHAALSEVNKRVRPPKPEAEIRRIADDYGTKETAEGPEVVIDERSAGIDAADLLALDLPPLRWIVPDIVPEGTGVIAAPPKVGKSCAVYQMSVEVALGGEFLGRRVTPGSALYLALEDGQRRGKDRLRAALAGRTMPHGRLEVRWSARRIGEGLEDDVAAWLDEHPDAALVAIDTLGRVRPRSNGRRNAYEVDVEDLGRLQSQFRDRSVALLIVHHARKEASDDFLASVSGTYGLTGSADTIVVIRRKRLEAFGTIVVTGRDVPDAEVPVRFDGLTWQSAPQSLGEASFERAEVFKVVEDRGPIFPAEIAEALGLSRTSVQNMVGRLVDGGAVVRGVRGYTVAGPVVEVARARVRVPDDSSDSKSHQSHGGHDRGLKPLDFRAEAERIYSDMIPRRPA